MIEDKTELVVIGGMLIWTHNLTLTSIQQHSVCIVTTHRRIIVLPIVRARIDEQMGKYRCLLRTVSTKLTQ